MKKNLLWVGLVMFLFVLVSPIQAKSGGSTYEDYGFYGVESGNSGSTRGSTYEDYGFYGVEKSVKNSVVVLNNKTEKEAYGKLVGAAKYKVVKNSKTGNYEVQVFNKNNKKVATVIAKSKQAAESLKSSLSKAKSPEKVYSILTKSYSKVEKFRIRSNGITAEVAPEKGKKMPHDLWDKSKFGFN